MATVVRQFGTGYQRTTVIYDEERGDYLWVRQPGADRAAIDQLDLALRETLERVHNGPVALTLPELDEAWAQRGAVAYRVGASSTVAEVLLAGVAGVADILRNATRLLAVLHRDASPGPQRLPTPAGPRRLLAWLRTGEGTRSAAKLRAEARSIMGERRLEMAAGWCGELLTGHGVLLHGAPGTGRLMMTGPDGSGCLQTGEDIALGPAEFDYGWLIGELVEHRESRPYVLGFDRLIVAAIEGCPSDVDLALLGRSAAIRYITHVFDFSAYVGWHDDLRVSLRRLAAVVDAADRAELLPQVSPA
jgi:hypothetical protein